MNARTFFGEGNYKPNDLVRFIESFQRIWQLQQCPGHSFNVKNSFHVSPFFLAHLADGHSETEKK